MTQWTLGIIGGSGLYELDGLEDRREEQIETPWGARLMHCCAAGSVRLSLSSCRVMAGAIASPRPRFHIRQISML